MTNSLSTQLINAARDKNYSEVVRIAQTLTESQARDIGMNSSGDLQTLAMAMNDYANSAQVGNQILNKQSYNAFNSLLNKVGSYMTGSEISSLLLEASSNEQFSFVKMIANEMTAAQARSIGENSTTDINVLLDAMSSYQNATAIQNSVAQKLAYDGFAALISKVGPYMSASEIDTLVREDVSVFNTLLKKYDTTVSGSNGDDSLYGTSYNDTIHAGKGNDIIRGGGGRDFINGEDGNDVLFGGAEDDILTGGAGRDIFVYAQNGGKDMITDFNKNLDKLDLSSILTKYLPNQHDIDDFISVRKIGTDTMLSVDVDGRTGGKNMVDIIHFDNTTITSGELESLVNKGIIIV